MRVSIKIKLLFFCMLSSIFLAGQHPNRLRINTLKKNLLTSQGIERIDNLNALSEEFWWLLHQSGDSISIWAIQANQDAQKLGYEQGLAKSIMNMGVAEIYKKNYIGAENLLRQALVLLEKTENQRDFAWTNLWLCQTLYCENKYRDALNYYLVSEPLMEKFGDWEGLGKAWAWVAFGYAAMGDYDSSFTYSVKSLRIREKMDDHTCIAASYTNMGHLYRMAGDKEDALDFYRQGRAYASTHEINFKSANWNYFDEPLAMIFRLLNQPDSSHYYLDLALKIDPENLMTHVSLGESYLEQREFDSALISFLPPIERFRKGNNRWDLMRVLLDAAKAYEGKNNLTTAIQYARESLAISREANYRPFLIENYLLLSKLHEKLGKQDSAYFFLQKYTALKDSLANDQFMFRISKYKKEAEFKKSQDLIASLDQENKKKEVKLRQDSLLKWTLAVGLLIAILTGLFIYRNLSLKRKNERLESEKSKSELKLKAAELEMQALRAQMNPHFIFNCLSSINRFILKSETEAASDYLTKFSRLIRIVLTNSKNKMITLEDELEMLRLYLDMERLRFKNSFSYNISFTNSIEADNIYVPPLLLQPFAENAIWHGLMNKESDGNLEINLSTDSNFLICAITDNGIGRKAAAEIKSWSSEKQKSMGLKITHERLALLNEFEQNKTFFEFEDLYDDQGKPAGTKVILRIRIKEPMESKHEA
jgi:hypothetical protein